MWSSATRASPRSGHAHALGPCQERLLDDGDANPLCRRSQSLIEGGQAATKACRGIEDAAIGQGQPSASAQVRQSPWLLVVDLDGGHAECSQGMPQGVDSIQSRRANRCLRDGHRVRVQGTADGTSAQNASRRLVVGISRGHRGNEHARIEDDRLAHDCTRSQSRRKPSRYPSG